MGGSGPDLIIVAHRGHNFYFGECLRVESALLVNSAIAESGLSFTCWVCLFLQHSQGCQGMEMREKEDGAPLFGTKIEAATSVTSKTGEMRKGYKRPDALGAADEV